MLHPASRMMHVCAAYLRLRSVSLMLSFQRFSWLALMLQSATDAQTMYSRYCYIMYSRYCIQTNKP